MRSGAQCRLDTSTSATRAATADTRGLRGRERGTPVYGNPLCCRRLVPGVAADVIGEAPVAEDLHRWYPGHGVGVCLRARFSPVLLPKDPPLHPPFHAKKPACKGGI